jgi:Fe-S-cluster containining protein
MNLSHLFQSYENLVVRADQAFQKVADEYPECVKCHRNCADCCHAVFGLFLVEAVYINQHFTHLDRKQRRSAVLRAKKSDKDLERLEKKLQTHQDNPQRGLISLARERVRCPLLDDHQECILYPYRPITCRVYGIPTAIHGKARVCGRAGFKKSGSYPAFDIDGLYRDLYMLSKVLLQGAGSKDLDKASLLISVSKAIRTPSNDLIKNAPGEPRREG